MGGYAHVLTSIPLDVYRQAVVDSCTRLHEVLQLAHKPGLTHLYDAIKMMEHRCQSAENILNSQLRSMGSDEEWADYFPNPAENPFEAARRRLPERVGEVEPSTGPPELEVELTENTLFSSDASGLGHGAMPPEATTISNWPKRFTQAYVDWCRGAAVEGSSCCVEVLYKQPEVTNLSQLDNCDILLLPETQSAGPYFNPLFFPKETLRPMYATGEVGPIRDHYSSQIREERFAVTMALAGGALFGAALNGVLHWFGLGSSSSDYVKSINANQEHIDQVARQVALTQQFTKSISERADQLAEREKLTEEFLHVMVGMQGLFDHLELITNGVSILFHQRQLSPLLVDRNQMIKEVRALEVEQREMENLLMIAPGDVWQCPLSYVVTRDLRIHVMIHVPTGKTSSFRKLYKYIPTPMAFLENGTHFLANPAEPYLLLDNNDQHPREMTREDVAACKMVNFYRRYCPSNSFQMNRSPPTCLTSLYEGSAEGVLDQCPIVLLNEDYPHVAELSFGEFTVYSRQPLTARVFCQDQPKSSVAFVDLSRVSLRRDCRVVHEDFVLEPSVDFSAQDYLLAAIPMALSDDLNDTLVDVLEWGEVSGELHSYKNANVGTGLTMAEVSQSWTQEKLRENNHWTWRGALMAGGVAMFLLIICCCCSRECWNAYQRHRQRQALGATIRSEVSQEMKDLLAKNSDPTAPASSVRTSRTGPSA